MGLPCQPGYEQDGAVFAINKHKMYAPIRLANHLGHSTYQALFRGSSDALRMSAIVLGSGFAMSSYQPLIAGNDWVMMGERQFCAHARIHRSPVDGAELFVQLINNRVLADGSKADDSICIDGNLPAQPLATALPGVESAWLQLQAAIPDPINRYRPMACTTRSITGLLDIVRAHPNQVLIILDNLQINRARTETSDPLLLSNVCGFFTCGPAVSDMPVMLYQLNTTRLARMDFSMTGTNANDTYMQIITSEGRSVACASPVATGGTVRLLNQNFPNSTSYILGIAWAPPGRLTNMQVQITYRGNPIPLYSGASSFAPSFVINIMIMALITLITAFH
jgi:hypothetical protein